MLKHTNLIEEAVRFFEDVLVHTPFGKEMQVTVENSPWHREANVWVHTRMVMNKAFDYLNSEAGQTLNDAAAKSLVLATMFHDVGKPMSKIEKNSEERGTYFAFHNHEVMSANIFIDYVMSQRTNYDEKYDFIHISPSMMTFVAFVIQEHLPYDMKQRQLHNLKRSVDYYGSLAGVNCPKLVFEMHIMSDTCGRISDDMVAKVAAALKWCADTWNGPEYSVKPKPPKFVYKANRECILLVGATCAGKSTWIKKNYGRELVEVPDVYKLVSSDDLRFVYFADVIQSDAVTKRLDGLGLTHDDAGKSIAYRNVIDRAVYQAFNENEVAYEEFYMKNFVEAFHKKQFIDNIVIVDRTNLTTRVQRRYAELARSKGCKIRAVVFLATFDTHVNNATQRSNDVTDRLNGATSFNLKSQYYARHLPMLGDVDVVEFVSY